MKARLEAEIVELQKQASGQSDGSMDEAEEAAMKAALQKEREEVERLKAEMEEMANQQIEEEDERLLLVVFVTCTHRLMGGRRVPVEPFCAPQPCWIHKTRPPPSTLSLTAQTGRAGRGGIPLQTVHTVRIPSPPPPPPMDTRPVVWPLALLLWLRA